MSIIAIIGLLAEYGPKIVSAGGTLLGLWNGAKDAIDSTTGKVDIDAYRKLVAFCDEELARLDKNAEDASRAS